VLKDYISKAHLKPMAVLNTHGHVDHLPGVSSICETYSIPFYMHSADEFLLGSAKEHGRIFGFQIDTVPEFDKALTDQQIFTFGESELHIFHVPGHSPGSVVMVSHNGKWVITGDVLFSGSIGRTDLPGGDYETLVKGIQDKLMTLPDEYRVYPGHGPYTTIGHERKNNPFLK
jgi:glyoxylase-like metal-dependent hydrolase (beta-lactamase superfamily II)